MTETAVLPVSRSVTLAAPAKVNLTLDVFPPRGDGYHDLDSVVVPFGVPSDLVTVTVRPGAASVTLIAKHAPPDFPRGPENLAHRAATAFMERFGVAATVYVKIDKRLPMQAGLGGGSSDAASVLLGLRESTGRGDRESLTDLAAALGSDTALFLHPSRAVRMRGRGEIVEPLPEDALPRLWGVIVKPDAGVPTGPAYAALDALPDRAPGGATARLLAALADGAIPDARALAPLLANDFEPAILPAFPAVAEAHAAVTAAGALRTLLCGSGAAVFGLAADRAQAKALTKALALRFPWVKMAASAAAEDAA